MFIHDPLNKMLVSYPDPTHTSQHYDASPSMLRCAFTCCPWNTSPDCAQPHYWLLEPKILKLETSDQSTSLQTSTLHTLADLAHHISLSWCFLLKSGFFTFKCAANLCLRRLRCTISTLISISFFFNSFTTTSEVLLLGFCRSREIVWLSPLLRRRGLPMCSWSSILPSLLYLLKMP